MEALQYFKYKKAEFAANQFSPKEALAFCKRLYKLGAKKVEIGFDEEYLSEEVLEPGDIYSDCMTITLPKSATKRLDLITAIFKEQPNEISKDSISDDRPVDWKKDGNVFLWWD